MCWERGFLEEVERWQHQLLAQCAVQAAKVTLLVPKGAVRWEKRMDEREYSWISRNVDPCTPECMSWDTWRMCHNIVFIVSCILGRISQNKKNRSLVKHSTIVLRLKIEALAGCWWWPSNLLGPEYWSLHQICCYSCKVASIPCGISQVDQFFMHFEKQQILVLQWW